MTLFSYCQSHIEGNKKCKVQCDHCKEYYKPLEKDMTDVLDELFKNKVGNKPTKNRSQTLSPE